MSASRLTLRLVKSFAMRTQWLLSIMGGRPTVLFSFGLSDSRGHWYARSFMRVKVGVVGVVGGLWGWV